MNRYVLSVLLTFVSDIGAEATVSHPDKDIANNKFMRTCADYETTDCQIAGLRSLGIAGLQVAHLYPQLLRPWHSNLNGFWPSLPTSSSPSRPSPL